jgi:hypothetical protein
VGEGGERCNRRESLNPHLILSFLFTTQERRKRERGKERKGEKGRKKKKKKKKVAL